MKIIACIKRVPTTDAQAKITPDGQSLDAAGFQYMTSFYDEIAVEQAILTKEALEGEVTVLTIGPSEVSKEVRECIAKGADGGVILVDGGVVAQAALERTARPVVLDTEAHVVEQVSVIAFGDDLHFDNPHRGQQDAADL